jgi:hypothetical protein
MAYYFGINSTAGAMSGVLEQSTTTSRDVEVVITTNANIGNRQELILALEKIQAYLAVASKNW